MKKTTNYNLSLYEVNDLANLTDGYNASMTKIDSTLKTVSNQATTNKTNITAEVTRAKAAESTLTTNLNAEITRAKGAESTLTTNLNAEITRAKAAESTLTRFKFRGGSISPLLVGSANKPDSSLGTINWSVQSICAKDDNTLVVAGTNYTNQKQNFFSTISLNNNTQTCVTKTFTSFSSHANSIYWDSEKNLYIMAAGNTSNYYIVGLDSNFNFSKNWNVSAIALDRDSATGKRYRLYTDGNKSYIAEVDANFKNVSTHELPYTNAYMGMFQTFRVVDGIFYLVFGQGIYIYTFDDGIVASYNNSSDVEFEGIAFANGGTYLIASLGLNRLAGNPGYAVYKIGLNSTSLGESLTDYQPIPQYVDLNSDNTFWFSSNNRILHTLDLAPSYLSYIQGVTLRNISYINIKRSTSINAVTMYDSYVKIENSKNFAVDMYGGTLDIVANEGGEISLAFDESKTNTVNIPSGKFFNLHFRTSASNVTFNLNGNNDAFRFTTSGSIDAIIKAFGHNSTMAVGASVSDVKFCKYAIAASMNRNILYAIISDDSNTYGVVLHSSNAHRLTFNGSETLPNGKLANVKIWLSTDGKINLETCNIAGVNKSLAYIY